MDALFKIDRRRELPGLRIPDFQAMVQGTPVSKGEKKIAYFYGCFTNTNEVDVGKATVEILEANGFEVVLPPQECCGIPMLGIGDLRAQGKWD